MKPLNNNFLVMPDEGVGAAIQAVGDDRWHLPMKGTVVAVPNRINSDWNYLHWARKKYKKSGYPSLVLERMRRIVKLTTEVKPMVEVNIGDRVMFSFIAHRNTNREGHEDLLLIHSEELICKIDPIEPLNGYLLVKMDENEDLSKSVNKYGSATVVYAAPCTEYRDGGNDDERIVVGNKVAFERSSCVRLEADEFNTLNPGGFSSLFRVRRRDVLSFA